MHRLLLVVLLAWPLLCAAQDEASIRYISDEISVTLRKDEGMGAEVAALVKSGTRVELLETGTEGYARVRVSPGREGWVLAKYLSVEAPARERVAKLAAEVAEKQAEVRKLQARIDRLEKQGTANAESKDDTPQPIVPVTSEEPVVHTLTLVGLVFAGMLLGMIISVLIGRRRRRWSSEL